jgi:5-methyltetrahydrofolate--homocysteine methyltransferase
MIIVGEKINTSRKKIAEAVTNRDVDFIVQAAREQAEAGADFIDVNAGTFLDKETECLCWLVETVQAHIDLPLCLDSPMPGQPRSRGTVRSDQTPQRRTNDKLNLT